MNKYIVGIDGMRCVMCETHVADVIRKSIKATKIKASYLKKRLMVITEKDLNEDDFKKLIDVTGYKVMSFKKETATKKIFGWR